MAIKRLNNIMTPTEITAYHHWLMKESTGDEEVLTKLIEYDMLHDNNPQAWDLMEKAVGNDTIGKQSFREAAQLLIKTFEENDL